VTPGEIILARHGEPALSRKVRLNAYGYRGWWALYEAGGLKEGQIPPGDLMIFARGARAVLSSTRPRAMESVAAITGDTPYVSDPIFVEAPLPPPPLPGWIRLSPKLWGVLSRACWWFLDFHDGQESRAQAETRAGIAAGRLIELAARGDVLLVAHGFFNTMIVRALKARGWRYAENQGWKYWSVKRLTRPAGLG